MIINWFAFSSPTVSYNDEKKEAFSSQTSIKGKNKHAWNNGNM